MEAYTLHVEGSPWREGLDAPGFHVLIPVRHTTIHVRLKHTHGQTNMRLTCGRQFSPDQASS